MRDAYLITGATGFIGSNLTRKLVSLGKDVHIISRKTSSYWRLRDIEKNLKVHHVSLLDKNLKKVVEKIKPTHIFHLAAYGSLPTESSLRLSIEVNLLGTANLLSSSTNTNYKLFINTGSSAEYGIKKSPFKETDTTLPVNDYGISKLAQTLYCQREASLNKLPLITLRLFSPYGYFEDRKRLIPHLILNSLRNKDIELSNPSYVRDFIFIDDVINAYLKSMNSKIEPGEIFNIGSSRQYSLGEVAKQTLKITNSQSKLKWGEVIKQKRQVEPNVWKADIKKAKTKLSWKPIIDLEGGISRDLSWFKKNQNLYD